jgi:Predicted membrane protein (DUF2127)
LSQLHAPTGSPASSPVPSERWAGWVTFAAIMLVVIGSINMIQGLVALLDDDYYLVRVEDDLLLTDFTVWGVVMLIWGGLQFLGGLSLASGRGWARWFAVLVAALSIILQIGFLSAYPIWSTLIIALDVIVIYSLTARWAESGMGR